MKRYRSTIITRRNTPTAELNEADGDFCLKSRVIRKIDATEMLHAENRI